VSTTASPHINAHHHDHSHSTTADHTIAGGIFTGQVAGLVMAVVVMFIFVVFYGKSPLYPVQVIGSLAFGEKALKGTNIGAVLAGLVFHQFGPSLLWGSIFGLIAKKWHVRKTSTSLQLGLGIGVVSMVGPYALIPVLMGIFQDTDIWNREVPTGWDWAAHLVFGATFALFPMIKHKLAHRRSLTL
jgi:hypothetical protein